jgi:hypothetical protein
VAESWGSHHDRRAPAARWMPHADAEHRNHSLSHGRPVLRTCRRLRKETPQRHLPGKWDRSLGGAFAYGGSRPARLSLATPGWVGRALVYRRPPIGSTAGQHTPAGASKSAGAPPQPHHGSSAAPPERLPPRCSMSWRPRRRGIVASSSQIVRGRYDALTSRRDRPGMRGAGSGFQAVSAHHPPGALAGQQVQASRGYRRVAPPGPQPVRGTSLPLSSHQ